MFSSRTDTELLRLYNGMCATAEALGVAHRRASRSVTRPELISACVSLHELILRRRAEEDAEPDPAERAMPAAGARRRSGMSDVNGAAMPEVTTTTEAPAPKKRTAKKTAAKKTAPTKKVPAKKAEKAAPATKRARAEKKRVAKKERKARVKMHKGMIIRVKIKKNPRDPQKEKMKYEQAEILMRADGQTVSKYKGMRGRGDYLASSVRKGWATLEEAK